LVLRVISSNTSNMSSKYLNALKRRTPLVLSKEKYNVMESMVAAEHIEGIKKRNVNAHNDQTALFKKMRNPKSSISKKTVKIIRHTKEQEAQVIAKRLKKDKKKQAKKNKKKKKTKTKTKTNEKTSKEYLEKLRVYEKNQCNKITKLRHFLEAEADVLVARCRRGVRKVRFAKECVTTVRLEM
jgi:hypothetical protein